MGTSGPHRPHPASASSGQPAQSGVRLGPAWNRGPGLGSTSQPAAAITPIQQFLQEGLGGMVGSARPLSAAAALCAASVPSDIEAAQPKSQPLAPLSFLYPL